MKLNRRNKATATFSMASLTDIIFLLLIFFVINSEMPDGQDLTLPNASGKAVSSKSITVTLTKDLVYKVNNKEVGVNELKSTLSNEISKSSSEEPSVILKLDKDVTLEYAVEIMVIGNELKVPMILATKPN